MVDFELTSEQISLQKKARDFAIHEIIPVSRKYDKSGEFPFDVLQKAFDQGLMNTIIPKKYTCYNLTKINHHR